MMRRVQAGSNAVVIGKSMRRVRRDHRFGFYALPAEGKQVDRAIFFGIVMTETIGRYQNDIGLLLLYDTVFPAGNDVLNGIRLPAKTVTTGK